MADRDLILVDLRGTGSSEPSLACPEVDDRVLLGAPGHDRAARARDRGRRGLPAAARPRRHRSARIRLLGHGTVTAHPCPRGIMQAFLADPAAPVDDSCIATMPSPFR